MHRWPHSGSSIWKISKIIDFRIWGKQCTFFQIFATMITCSVVTKSWSWIYYYCNLYFQLVIGCQNARKKSPERQILRLSGEEESGHFSGEEELEDTTHHNNARGKLMQKPETENSNSRAGSSSGHSSGHMSHRNEITSGTYTIFNTYSVG